MFREKYDAAFHLQDGIIKMSDTKLQWLYNRKVNATQSIDKDKDNIHIKTSIQKLMQWVEKFAFVILMCSFELFPANQFIVVIYTSNTYVRMVKFYKILQGSLLLTWITFYPSMDK